MKKQVEENIKKAFEKWENQNGDFGFDKDSVWSSIQKGDEKEFYFQWRKLAAVFIVLITVSGLVFSYINNNSLAKENESLVAKVQLQKDTITSLKKNVKTEIITKVKTDTIVQFVTRKKEKDISSIEKNKLRQQNDILTQELQRVHQLLDQKEKICGLLNDSVEVLIASLHSVSELTTQREGDIDKDISNTEEAEILAMSKKESDKEKWKESKEYRPRFKVVLFNNPDKETACEAPKKQGIRLNN